MLLAASQRILASLGLMLFLSFLIYSMIGLMPGDPLDLMIQSNPDFTSEDRARLAELYGLNQPLIERYFLWLKQALSGDLGYSRLFVKPVIDILPDAMMETLILTGFSLFIALGLAVILSLYSAFYPHGAIDKAINMLALSSLSIPSFWLALILIIAFAVILRWLPSGGTGDIDQNFLDSLRYWILPIAALSFASLGSYIRFLRASLLENLAHDYVKTAYAKGLARKSVIMGHILRQSCLPLATLLGLSFGNLLSGSLIIEALFARPGMGSLIYQAIMGNDYNLALAGLMLSVFLTLLGNMLADGLYRGLDPRVRMNSKTGKL